MGGGNTPESFVVYKVDKNSPIIAGFKLFADDTAGRPEFYASPDGKSWTKLEMTTDQEISGNIFVNYLSEGIGEDNRYIKIVICNTALGAVWYSDLQQLSFNSNKEPSPYDLTVNFVSDATALARLYNFTPPQAFEQILNTGLLLTVDYLSGGKNLENPRAIVAVKNGSGFMAQFMVSKYTAAMNLFPKLYASADGKKWDLIEDYEIFPTGSSTDYTNYRLTIEKLDSKYEFIAFEYPQTQDYTGTELKELDDYIPDCLNAGVILTSMSFMRSEKHTSLIVSGTDSENPENPSNSNGSIGKDDDSPITGVQAGLLQCLLIAVAALSLMAFAWFGAKNAKKVGDEDGKHI